MATVEVKKDTPVMTTTESYQTCLLKIEQAGYKIFKKRDLANLIICNETTDGQKVNLSLMVPFGSPTAINLSLSSELMDEAELLTEAERIFSILVPDR